MTPIHAAPATRRAVLGVLTAGVTTAGCELEPARESSPSLSRRSSAPQTDPDAALVDSVVEDVATVLALVAAASRAHRPLRTALLPWRRLHTAHLSALEASPTRRGDEAVRGDESTLLARVRRDEAALERRLAAAAASARSGALASLLATMSAAVAQQLAAGPPRSAG